jgi:hypothetical protein
LCAINRPSNWENQCPFPATLLPVEVARTIGQSATAVFADVYPIL